MTDVELHDLHIAVPEEPHLSDDEDAARPGHHVPHPDSNVVVKAIKPVKPVQVNASNESPTSPRRTCFIILGIIGAVVLVASITTAAIILMRNIGSTPNPPQPPGTITSSKIILIPI